MTDLKRIKRVTLGTMCFALFMVMLDSTVVNLALPTIQKELGASMTELQWIVDAFVLRSPACCSPAGPWATCTGAARRSSSASALFTVGSARLCPRALHLRADRRRLFQGVGGALMMPSTLSILTNTFPDARERARAIGIWAGVSGLALAIGPLVGGWLVDNFGWQSIFWINVPIGVVAIVMALRFVPESSDRAGRGLDLAGQVTADRRAGGTDLRLHRGQQVRVDVGAHPDQLHRRRRRA